MAINNRRGCQVLLSGIKIYDNIDDEEAFKVACKKKKIDINNVQKWEITKKSVDARDKSDIHFEYSFEVFMNGEEVPEYEDPLVVKDKKELKDRPVVVGAGPAGLFCAYTLALNGYNPILIEQGKEVDERVKDVEEFIKNRKLNPLSNIQFGEGGAGTFSDGKLTTGVNTGLNKAVLDTFVKFGAPEQIKYLSKPHIGTDNLRKIVKVMREEIIRLGGEVRFNTKFEDFTTIKDEETHEDALESILTSDGRVIYTSNVVLAIGHSARSTFEKLYEKKVSMEPKPFSVGVRVEHRQSDINEAQYGENPKLKLPPAEYKLVYHSEDGRALYTFCMCPGGFVMASSSDENTIVTNGMSYFNRDGENANSAILVSVTPDDCKAYSSLPNYPLNGVLFQKQIEEKAFLLGGSNYNAPAQRMGDFLRIGQTLRKSQR